jgi:hypothetical protein
MKKAAKTAPTAGVRPRSDGPRLAYSAQQSKSEERRAKRCVAITKAGDPCPRPQMGGLNVCNFHREGGAARAGQIGGHRRSVYNPDKLFHFEAPKTVDECLAILGQIAAETHRGELDPRVANTLSTVLNTLLSAIEIKEQGALLAELERRTGLQDSVSQLRDEVTGRFQ